MTTYAEGQVWRYRTRPGEESSQLQIHRVEQVPAGEVFHISVDGLQIRNPFMPSGYQQKLMHSPVSRETLDASVTKLVREDGPAADEDFEEGYNLWSGDKGGIFSTDVASIVANIESIVTTSAETNPTTS